jgi:hypothetical protein
MFRKKFKMLPRFSCAEFQDADGVPDYAGALCRVDAWLRAAPAQFGDRSKCDKRTAAHASRAYPATDAGALSQA